MALQPSVLVLGGYGTFGSRIARRLAVGGARVMIAGRSLENAQRFADSLRTSGPHINVTPLRIDCGNINMLKDMLTTVQPTTVVHTVGPFQGSDYSIPKAIIESGAHYLDLADARGYVCGFGPALDALALKHNVAAITGVSSVPGVSTAAIDCFIPSFERVLGIDIGISPGNQTPRGTATVAAILSYAGKNFNVVRGGKNVNEVGWGNSYWREYPIELGRRLLSPCDVPDLELLPSYYNTPHVSFSAGLELWYLHQSTVVLAHIARVLNVSLSRFAEPLRRLSELVKFAGSTRGGMHIEIIGLDARGCKRKVLWFLCADNGSNNKDLDNVPGAIAGPEIPCTPAVVIAHKLTARGREGAESVGGVGARPCLSSVTLEECMHSLRDYKVWDHLMVVQEETPGGRVIGEQTVGGNTTALFPDLVIDQFERAQAENRARYFLERFGSDGYWPAK